VPRVKEIRGWQVVKLLRALNERERAMTGADQGRVGPLVLNSLPDNGEQRDKIQASAELTRR
jgi:hypothetical protein